MGKWVGRCEDAKKKKRTSKQEPIPRSNPGEANGRDGGPELARVVEAGGEGVLDAVVGVADAGAGEQGLRGEEVGVEDWGEDDLVDEDFGGEGEEEGGWVVEEGVEVHEPFGWRGGGRLVSGVCLIECLLSCWLGGCVGFGWLKNGLGGRGRAVRLPCIPWDCCSSPYGEVSEGSKGIVGFAIDVLGQLVPTEIDGERCA